MTVVLANAIPFPEGHRDAAVAWHYGDPLGEQRKLSQGIGSVDMSHRGVIELAGEDRITYLNSLTTQKLLDLKDGDSALTLNLNPQGFVLHELHVIATDSTLLITCEAESTEEILDYLRKMRFRSKIEVADRSADLAVVWQPVSQRHPEFPTWISPFNWAARELVVPRSEVAEIVEPAAAGMWAYTAIRIAARVPRQGAETDHHTVAHEPGWVGPAVHLNKGCYRGQETVSKIERMGQPPRRFAVLLLDGNEDLPKHGAEVKLGERTIGFVGDAVQHFELGPIASALIKRDTAVDADLLIAAQSASELGDD